MSWEMGVARKGEQAEATQATPREEKGLRVCEEGLDLCPASWALPSPSPCVTPCPYPAHYKTQHRTWGLPVSKSCIFAASTGPVSPQEAKETLHPGLKTAARDISKKQV